MRFTRDDREMVAEVTDDGYTFSGDPGLVELAEHLLARPKVRVMPGWYVPITDNRERSLIAVSYRMCLTPDESTATAAELRELMWMRNNGSYEAPPEGVIY